MGKAWPLQHFSRQIFQHAGIFVIDVRVRIGTRVINRALRIKAQCAQQTFFNKQRQGVVNRCARQARQKLACRQQYVIGGHVHRAVQKNLCNRQALAGGLNASGTQLCF